MGAKATIWRVRKAAGCTLLLGALLLAGCSGIGHVEGRLSYPPERPPPAGAPLPPGELPPAPPPRAPAPEDREETAPAGIYFLHEQPYGAEDCQFVGERVTGGTAAAAGTVEGEKARARAVLDLADQASWLGGNVVLLPNFREDYRAGRLLGRIYRCPEPQRRSIYDRAAADGALTVVPR